MIENGFVYAVNKSLEKERNRKKKQDKKTEKLYNIFKKYNKTLDELTKEILTKKELEFITDYIINTLNYPLRWYTNLI